jgi:hypothetical protein
VLNTEPTASRNERHEPNSDCTWTLSEAPHTCQASNFALKDAAPSFVAVASRSAIRVDLVD